MPKTPKVDTPELSIERGKVNGWMIGFFLLLGLAVGAIVFWFVTSSQKPSVTKSEMREEQEHAQETNVRTDDEDEDEDAEENLGEVSEWKETGFMGAYTFEYPYGWHVASLWPEDYSKAITIAVNPTPVSTAPRGGPLAEITILDTSGNDNPGEILNERLEVNKNAFDSYEIEEISTKNGTVYHITGKINLYEEIYETERYVFTFEAMDESPINVHIIEIVPNPFNEDIGETLERITMSFEKYDKYNPPLQ